MGERAPTKNFMSVESQAGRRGKMSYPPSNLFRGYMIVSLYRATGLVGYVNAAILRITSIYSSRCPCSTLSGGLATERVLSFLQAAGRVQYA